MVNENGITMWNKNDYENGLKPESWERIVNGNSWLKDLEIIEQEPRYHGEGNVLNHVKMVLESVMALKEWPELTEQERYVLFSACLMHDIGKLFCTKKVDGIITSKNHSRKGAIFCRQILWQGIPDPVPFALREEIVTLILLHSLPLWLHEKSDPAKTVIKASQSARLKLLVLLATADVEGRICDDQEELLMRISLFKDEAQRLGCYEQPFEFKSGAARYLYFTKDNASRVYEPYERYGSEVILMSGVPGAGKDFWIGQNAVELPMISLDEIRMEMGISPQEKQHAVIHRAKEDARALLRNGENFAWNATNISRRNRKLLVDLFVAYQAKVVIVYIEPDYAVVLKQNKGREKPVPDTVMEKMINTLEVPAIHEAHDVIFFTGREQE